MAMGDDYTPYRARRGDVAALDGPFVFGELTRLVEMPISWTLDDYPHFEFVRTRDAVLQGLMATAGVLQNWLDDFAYLTRTLDWGALTYTCHPFVIGRGHRMMMLERLIVGLIEQGAVFLTMEQAVDEFLAGESTGSDATANRDITIAIAAAVMVCRSARVGVDRDAFVSQVDAGITKGALSWRYRSTIPRPTSRPTRPQAGSASTTGWATAGA